MSRRNWVSLLALPVLVLFTSGCDSTPTKLTHFVAQGYVRHVAAQGLHFYNIVFEGENHGIWTIREYTNAMPPLWVDLHCVVAYDIDSDGDARNLVVVRRLL